MNVFSTKAWVTIFVLVSVVAGLSFKLTTTPICLKFKGGGSYNLEYISSGIDDEKVKMQLYENSNMMMQKQGVSEFYEKLNLPPGDVDICFTNLNRKEKVISFDFYQEDDPFKTIIDKKDLRLVFTSLVTTIESMKEVGRNQQFHIDRDEVNKKILEESEVKIKWTGIIKIFFLLASALVQVWIMKGFFKQNSMPYQPVSQ